MKEFACGSVLPGCLAMFRDDDDDGVMVQVAEHALEHHGLPDVSPDLVAQVRSLIRATDQAPPTSLAMSGVPRPVVRS
jgi:predicted small metal-binding protein